MGVLTGFGDRDLKIYRRGLAFQGKEGAFPTYFSAEVTGQGYEETWCEGLAVFHNPNAKVPFPDEALPDAGHFKLFDGELLSRRPEFFPFGSEAWTLSPENDGEDRGQKSERRQKPSVRDSGRGSPLRRSR